MTEQDDLENWLYATRASVGTVARRYPFNYQQSMHNLQIDPEVYGIRVSGEVSTQISEHMPRRYYRRWSQYLDGQPWEELLGRTDPVFQAQEA